MGNSVDVVIPIYKAGNDFVKMLEKLYKQSKRPEHIYLLQTIESKSCLIKKNAVTDLQI